MLNNFKTGDYVELISLPDWLLSDLPLEEQEEIKSYIGLSAKITEIDQYGYICLGFGNQNELGDTAFYNGHSFCVLPENIILEKS